MVHRSRYIPVGDRAVRTRFTPRGRAAFSMIELMLVVATLAIISAMAAPRYGAAVAHYRADAASKRIAADLAFAMSRARSTSKPITVVFTIATKSYQMATVPDPLTSAAVYTVNLGSEPYNASIVSADFSGVPQVTYSIYGGPSSAGTVVISVGSFQKTITLDGVTGKTTIQ
jgi:type II secretory pathway pseudopilin PulG